MAAPSALHRADTRDLTTTALQTEANYIVFWLLAGCAIETAAQARASTVLRQTRRLRQLMEESAAEQERIIGRGSVQLLTDLATDYFSADNAVVGLLGSLLYVFDSRADGNRVAATALLAYFMGRELIADVPHLVRPPKRERQMLETLAEMVGLLTGHTVAAWDSGQVRAVITSAIAYIATGRA